MKKDDKEKGELFGRRGDMIFDAVCCSVVIVTVIYFASRVFV